MKLDGIWKSPSDAVEDFDRTMALRIAQVGAEALSVESVEGWHEDVQREAEAYNEADGEVEVGPALAGRFRLLEGEAFLRAADGTEWVLSTPLFDHDMQGSGPGDNRFLQRLYALIVEHRALMGHSGSELEAMLLRRDSLDYRRAWCTSCEAWCDLQTDAEEADRTLEPWPEM